MVYVNSVLMDLLILGLKDASILAESTKYFKVQIVFVKMGSEEIFLEDVLFVQVYLMHSYLMVYVLLVLLVKLLAIMNVFVLKVKFSTTEYVVIDVRETNLLMLMDFVILVLLINNQLAIDVIVDQDSLELMMYVKLDVQLVNLLSKGFVLHVLSEQYLILLWINVLVLMVNIWIVKDSVLLLHPLVVNLAFTYKILIVCVAHLVALDVQVLHHALLVTKDYIQLQEYVNLDVEMVF